MDIEDKNVLIRSTEWSNKDLKLNELNMRGRGGGGGLLVHLLGSRNSLGLLPMIAPEPLCPPNPVNLCKYPFNTAPPPPNFLATPLVAPITRSSSQPLTPSFHPLASRPNCCPLSKHFPSSLSFSRSLRPTAVNAPRTVVLSVHLSSKPTRLSPIQGSHTLSLSRSLYPLLCLSGSLSRSPREVKYSQLLLRSGRTATRLSEQTEEL